MADKKISQLPAATLPLAGTELLPIVQSGTTDNITVNNLAAGNLKSNATTGVLQVTGPAAASTRVMTTPDANFTAARTDAAQNFVGNNTFDTTTLTIDATNDCVGVGVATANTYNSNFASYKSSGSFNAFLHDGSTGTFPKVSALSFGNNSVSYTYTSNGTTNALTGSAHIAAHCSAAAGAPTELVFYTTSGGAVTEQFRIKNNNAISLYTSNDTTGSTTINLTNSPSVPAGAAIVSTKSAAGAANLSLKTATGGSLAERINISATGDVTVSTGNLVIGTSGKGIDFSATASGSGTMTSELLSDYEEGTWTPGQGGGVTVVGSFSSEGYYTKIGRNVTVSFKVSGSTSIAVNSGSSFLTGLPFSGITGKYFFGSGANGNFSISSAMVAGETSIYSSEAVAATPSIYGTVTYMV